MPHIFNTFSNYSCFSPENAVVKFEKKNIYFTDDPWIIMCMFANSVLLLR